MKLSGLFKRKESATEDEFLDDDDEIEEEDEVYDVYDAALMWASRGMDEDYTCGYTEEELKEALKRGY